MAKMRYSNIAVLAVTRENYFLQWSVCKILFDWVFWKHSSSAETIGWFLVTCCLYIVQPKQSAKNIWLILVFFASYCWFLTLITADIQDTDVLVGNDIGNIDMARWQIKTPFERHVVTQFDAQV